MKAAENIGSALGTVMARVDAWMSQRQEIAAELRRVADMVMAGENPLKKRVTTPSMLREEALTGKPARARRKKRTMSAEARAKIAAAQRARWAKQKAGGGGLARAGKRAKKG
jgi:hypothetical protein